MPQTSAMLPTCVRQQRGSWTTMARCTLIELLADYRLGVPALPLFGLASSLCPRAKDDRSLSSEAARTCQPRGAACFSFLPRQGAAAGWLRPRPGVTVEMEVPRLLQKNMQRVPSFCIRPSDLFSTVTHRYPPARQEQIRQRAVSTRIWRTTSLTGPCGCSLASIWAAPACRRHASAAQQFDGQRETRICARVTTERAGTIHLSAHLL